MEEELKQLLQEIIIKKMFVENALKQYSIMMNFTGLSYKKEVDALLDQKIALEKVEKELNKKRNK